MVEISINERRVINYFEKLVKTVKDLRPIWEEYLVFHKSLIKQNFDTTGRIMQEARWQQYSPKYFKWKRKHYAGKPMLVLSGAMRAAAQGGPGWFEKIKPLSMDFGTKGKIYWGVHQYGSSKINMPQRAYLWQHNDTLPKRGWNELIKIADSYLEKKAKEGAVL